MQGKKPRQGGAVVHAALRPYQRRRAVLRAEIERARGEIAAGADDLDQRRIVAGDAFFREWDADLDKREEAARLPTP